MTALALGARAAHADDPPPAPKSLEDRIRELEDEVKDLRAAAVDAVDVKEPAMRLYGFIDMGLQKLWAANDPVVPTRATTFVLGNIDLYFDFHPLPDWSSLVETRLTNYAQGAEQVGVTGIQPYQAAPSAEVTDLANGTGYDRVRVSSIVLERAYIQWQRHQELGVRVGQFLTPYGIWNVDHGSPTLIAIDRPEFVTKELWPAHQLGVEVFGQTSELLPDGWTLEYHATVSNGRNPGSVDLGDNKTLGGRVVASRRGLRFGVSAFHGDYLRQAREVDPATEQTTSIPLVAYTEGGVAADASLDFGPLRLRSEFTLRHVDYTEDLRDAAYVPGVYVADGYQGDAYALAAYRIPGTKLEPYAYVEGYHAPTIYGDLLIHLSAGANYYFAPSVQLKVQATRTWWTNLEDPDFSERSAAGGKQTFLTAKLVMGF